MEQNYLPLFRKYRPQSFKDIVGQESLVKALTNAIELNRIAQAYLFCGPRGTGKTSSARIFAKSLNCEHGPTTEPCQKCASCIDITNATGLDVIEIDAASNRGIQDAKEVISQAQYASNGKYKIFIIDEVHMLSTEAFNALLKTFEEPPKNVIFILATTEPHKVLETIVSRCQRFDLRRITVDDIVKRLREISDLENIKITDNALYTIAKNVSGGLRDSLALLDQVSILGVKDEIDKDLIEELLGKINFDVLLDLLKKINSSDIEATIEAINNIYAKGNEPRNLAENFIEFLRNTILVLSSKNAQNITDFTNLIQDDIENIRKENFNKDKILNILNILIEYYKEIKVSTNPYLWVELAGIACCKSDSKPTIQKPLPVNNIVSKPVEQPKAVIEEPKPVVEQPKPVIEESKPVIEQSKPAPIQTSDTSNIWVNIIDAIDSRLVKSFFSNVPKLVEIKDNTIVLGFLSENLIAQAKSDMKFSSLQKAINAIAPDYKTEFIKMDSNTKTIAFKPKPQQNKPKPQVQPVQNPINKESEEIKRNENRQYSSEVKDMLEQFNGRIIEES